MKITGAYRTAVLGLLGWVLISIIQLKSDVSALQAIVRNNINNYGKTYETNNPSFFAVGSHVDSVRH